METKEKKEQKKPIILARIILIIIVIAGICFGSYWFYNYYSFISTDKAAIESTKITISSKIMGRVKNININDGDKVESGQLLLELDNSDLLAQRDQYTASLKLSNENLNLSKVNLDKAEKDFARIKNLYTAKVATDEQYEHGEQALKASTVQSSISQAQLNISKTQLEILNTQLLNTRLFSPVKGVITKKNVMQGEIVQPGQAIAIITDLTDIWITANFDETKISFIKPKQHVEITIDAYKNYTFSGHVEQISSAIVPPAMSIGETTKTTQKIPVKILFDKFPDSMILLPGMSVEVKIKVK